MEMYIKNRSSLKLIKLIFIPLILVHGCQPPNMEVVSVNPSVIAKSIKEIVGVCLIQPQEGMIDLATRQSGLTKTIFAHENDIVKEGEILMELDRAVIQAQINQCKAKLHSSINDLQSAEIEVENGEEEYQNEKVLLESAEVNFKLGAISEQERNKQLLNTNQSKRKLESKRISLINARLKSKEIESDLKYYQELFNQYQVVAPVDGQIIKWNKQEGEFSTLGEVVGELSPTAPLVAKMEVDELFANKVGIQNKVIIYSPATGEILTNGYVSFISNYLSSKSIFEDESNKDDRRVRQVIITLESADNVMIGMKLDAKIILDL